MFLSISIACTQQIFQPCQHNRIKSALTLKSVYHYRGLWLSTHTQTCFSFSSLSVKHFGPKLFLLLLMLKEQDFQRSNKTKSETPFPSTNGKSRQNIWTHMKEDSTESTLRLPFTLQLKIYFYFRHKGFQQDLICCSSRTKTTT